MPTMWWSHTRITQLKYKLTVNSSLIYYEFYIGRLFSLFFSLGNISSIFSVMGIFTNWKAQFVWMFMCERNHMSEYVLFWAFLFIYDNENVAPLIMSIGHADWAIHVHKHGVEIQKCVAIIVEQFEQLVDEFVFV